MKKVSPEVLWYGKYEPLPEPVILHSGPLEITYEPGLIRNVRIGEYQVLRMVYFAVRDHNWRTIIPVVKNQSIEKTNDSFSISFECHYHEREIEFVFYARIKGNENGSIIFELEGKALTDFNTNRIGFCVLHPIQESRGKSCEITTPEGDKKKETFPELISSHQPMQNISSLSWPLDTIGKATISFEGDVFEMEDQRNWTDDSYKTYCRPLDLPFPYLLKKGDKVHQKITLSVSLNNKTISRVGKSYFLKISPRDESKLPEIGIGQSTLRSNLSTGETKLLKEIKFDFYEIDLEFNHHWKSELKQGIEEAGRLGYKLSLKVYFSSDYNNEISLLKRYFGTKKSRISSFVIFSQKSIVPTNTFIAEISKGMRAAFPETRIGAGTNGFFADLNRNRIDTDKVDFISYSINPQVHAFDNASLIENLHGQGETLETAFSFAGGRGIHIKPVTLKMQVNPAATSEQDVGQRQSDKIDPRQMSLFGAGWTLGSLKNLTQSGASSITFFETVGEKGIIQGDQDPIFLDIFHVGKNAVFPMYYVFSEFLSNKSAKYIHSYASHPTIFEGLVLKSNGKKVILLANFTDQQITVRVDEIAPTARVKKLDANNVLNAMYNHDDFVESPYCEFNFNLSGSDIKIQPFGIAIVRE